MVARPGEGPLGEPVPASSAADAPAPSLPPGLSLRAKAVVMFVALAGFIVATLVSVGQQRAQLIALADELEHMHVIESALARVNAAAASAVLKINDDTMAAVPREVGQRGGDRGRGHGAGPARAPRGVPRRRRPGAAPGGEAAAHARDVLAGGRARPARRGERPRGPAGPGRDGGAGAQGPPLGRLPFEVRRDHAHPPRHDRHRIRRLRHDRDALLHAAGPRHPPARRPRDRGGPRRPRRAGARSRAATRSAASWIR